MALQENLVFVNLEQAGRAILLAFFANIPLALWGAPGIGKSAKVYQIAALVGWRLYDFRLSDKEASDIGGIPFPVKVGDVPKYIEYLIARGLLPFDTDEECILFLDEIDRTDNPAVKNAIQQVILDRKCNGHFLSPNCRIVMAGNGTSDIDTSPLSKAANGRMVHLYIENVSNGALDSWLDWATDEDPIDPADLTLGTETRASGLLISFAQFNREVWRNGQAKEEMLLSEQAEPTNRTWIYADRLLRAADNPEIDYKTSDILLALVAGCVGKTAATQLLGYRDIYLSAPSIDAIIADPEHVDVPTRPDILTTLTYSLTDFAVRDRAVGEAVATYGLRWPEEPASLLFRRLLAKQPLVATTTPFLTWQNGRMKHTPSKQYPASNNYQPELVTIFKDSIPLPENDGWINRIQIPSSRAAHGVAPYILSQTRKEGIWQCSCPGWVHRRSCDHVKRVPAHMKGATTPVTV